MTRAGLTTPLPLSDDVDRRAEACARADSFVNAVERALAGSRGRVVRMEFDGRVAWVKRAVTTKVKRTHRLQDALARLLRVDLMRFTCDVSGQATLEREAAIIRALAAKGVRVPEVLAIGPGWLAIGDLGESLRKQLDRAAGQGELRAIAFVAAHAVRRLHASDAWHGNPLVRNMAGDLDRVGFLDFEEDPAKHMGADSLRARDLLLFLFSLAPFERRAPGLLKEAAAIVLKGQPEAAVSKLRTIHRVFAPVAWMLSPFRRVLGRDVRTSLDLHQALDLSKPGQPTKVRWGVVGGVGTLVALALYALILVED